MKTPLAQLIRPTTFDNVFGQHHLLDKGTVFRRVVDSAKIPNMIFYGPSGSGKTTVARIIAENCGMHMVKLNGTNVSTAEIKNAIAESSTLMGNNGVLIYLDEIQYLNKKQQQSMLECIEDGSVTLISSTTENPYFYVYNALLSRCTVFEFKPLDSNDVRQALDRAFEILNEDGPIDVGEEARDYLAKSCGGDVRKALNAVDLLVVAARASDKPEITLDDVKQVTARSATRYDREDDTHYDLLSALQKSVRGSDPDAALHYLARLLESGDLISPCRRLLVIASEDIGLAYPMAAAIVKACVDSAFQLGLPEAVTPLAQAVVLLATSPKSNSSNEAYYMAAEDVRKGGFGEVPDYLRGTGYSGAQKLGRGLDYKYPHAFADHYVQQEYLPSGLRGKEYYVYGENKTEQAAKQYWQQIKKRADEKK